MRALKGTPLQVAARSTPADDGTLGAPGLLVLAALGAAMVGQGGFHHGVGAVCVALVVVAGALATRRGSLTRRLRLIGSGLGVMAAAAVVTATVDHHPSAAVAPVALLAALGAVVAVVEGAGTAGRRQLLDATVGLGAFVALTGWVGAAWRVSPLGHVDGGLWRAATTITYANASAAVLVVLALLALATLVEAPSGGRRLATTAVLVGLGATSSRAGVATLVAGLAVLACLVGPLPVLRAAGLPVSGAAVAVLALAAGMPAAHAGRPAVALVGLVAGLGLGSRARLLPPARVGRSGRRRDFSRRASVAAASVVAVGVAVAAGALVAGHSHAWSGRLGLSSPDRTSVAHAALHLWSHHILSGVGPGQAVFVWTTAQHQPVFDRYAHDEYLQLAVEEGAVGLVALGALVATVAVAAKEGLRSRPLGATAADGSWALPAGAVAALVAFAAHSGADFLWHVPAVVLVAALAVGLTAPPHPSSDPQP